jgi:hypothetical protein
MKNAYGLLAAAGGYAKRLAEITVVTILAATIFVTTTKLGRGF